MTLNKINMDNKRWISGALAAHYSTAKQKNLTHEQCMLEAVENCPIVAESSNLLDMLERSVKDIREIQQIYLKNGHELTIEGMSDRILLLTKLRPWC